MGCSYFRGISAFVLVTAFTVSYAQKVPIIIPPFVAVAEKKTEFPLKKEKLIFTDQDILLAKNNIRQFAGARQVRDSIAALAGKWISWDDQDLRDLIPDARVPRAFDLNIHGCPVHGDTIFNIGGVYPWILDFHRPLTVKCPAGGEIYPSNDFHAYAKGGFEKKNQPPSEFEDDGWGWVAPDQERYWFVAYANEHLQRELSLVLQQLSRAYVLTGDPGFAHKAIVILGRLAEVYPSMDHASQSRYGAMLRQQGEDFPGKIFYHIQEARFIKIVAEAYDLVWDYIDKDKVIQAHYQKDGARMREFIEANVLEEAVRAYKEKKIQGNYGMHQNALLYTLLARQHPSRAKYIGEMIDSPGENQPRMGLRYTLYNQVFRDGMALESPEYNFDWINELSRQMTLVKKATRENLFAVKKSKALFDSPLKSIVTGRYTPDIGDTGHTLGGAVGRSTEVYQALYDEYKDPAYQYWLAPDGKTGPATFSTFESLFRPVIPAVSPLPDQRLVQRQKSRLFAGYGVGILNNVTDKTAVALTYGKSVYHYHNDFLNFELFANGQKMMPDFGYPDAMNAYVKELYAWSVNTVSHNTVVVDAQKQNRNTPGVLHDFAEGDFARTIDASSGAYTQASVYRRNLIMIDVDSIQSYVVDFFRVAGGRQHDYILHGPPGKVNIPAHAISGKAGGALTGGKEVDWGHIYDDEVLGQTGYAGSFSGYKGSGYQYLFNVERLAAGDHTLGYEHVSDPGARVRIHRLHQSNHSSFIADAYDKPRAKKHLVKFIVARNEATSQDPLESSFVSVLEPYPAAPYIVAVKEIGTDGASAKAVEVIREKETDIVISDIVRSEKSVKDYPLSTDATAAVVTLDRNSAVKRVFFSNGSHLKYGDQTWEKAPVSGLVESVDYEKGEILVAVDDGIVAEEPETAGVAYFSNGLRTTAHPVSRIRRDYNGLVITVKDDLVVGKISVKIQNGPAITSLNSLPLHAHYKGAYLLDNDYRSIGLVGEARDKEVKLHKPDGVSLSPGSEVWIGNVGVGDRIELKAVFSKSIR